MSDICIACKVVGKRQHGVTCDVCDRWQDAAEIDEAAIEYNEPEFQVRILFCVLT